MIRTKRRNRNSRPVTLDDRARLRLEDVRRALRRRHQRCRSCKSSRTVCTLCGRMMCLRCHSGCPYGCNQSSVIALPQAPAVSTSISNSVTKPRAAQPTQPTIAWPREIAPLAPELAQLGLIVNEIHPADTKVFARGKWALHCTAPKGTSAPPYPDFPSLTYRKLAYNSEPNGRGGTRITVILG